MTAAELASLLPWRAPFLMLDRMVECVPHDRIVTWKRVTANDSLAEGADGDVVDFPSALVLEGLSQTAALLFRLSYGPEALAGAPLLGHLRCEHSGGAHPGDTIEYSVQAVKMTSRTGLFTGTARVDGRTIAHVELGFGVRR